MEPFLKHFHFFRVFCPTCFLKNLTTRQTKTSSPASSAPVRTRTSHNSCVAESLNHIQQILRLILHVMEDTSGELPCFAEAELMEAAYGHCFQLCDPTGYDGVVFSVNLELLETILKISLPAKYPEEPLRFSLDGKFTHSEGKSLRLDLNQFVGETGQVGSLELCQQATELLRELSDKKQKMSNSTVARPVYMRKEVIIARFSIYFHHIWRYQHLISVPFYFHFNFCSNCVSVY